MRLFPKNRTEFFELFRAQNEKLQKISALLLEFSRDFQNFEKYANRAEEIEHEADAVTHDLIDMLNRLFITPFDREDIYLLTQEFDDIVDLVEHVIRNIKLYGITAKMKFFEEFAVLIEKAAGLLERMLTQLQNMKHTPELSTIKIEIHKLEDAGDLLFDMYIKELFAMEKDPIQLIKTKDILENLEAIMDKYQKLANVIEGIIMKST